MAGWREPPDEGTEAFRTLVRAILDEAARVVRSFGEQIRPLLQQIQRHAVDCDHEGPPSDPRERALWLRRRRNTGPRPAARTPRRFDPPGGLRRDARGRSTYRPVRL